MSVAAAIFARAALLVCIATPVAAGAQQPPQENDPVPDKTFGSGGRTLYGFVGTDVDGAMHVVPASIGYWVLGYTRTNVGGTELYRLTLSRLDVNGAPIAAFGMGGHVHTTIAALPFGSALVDSQGRLLVALRTPDDSALDGVARFLLNGALDTTFAGDGIWESEGTGTSNEVIYDIALGANDAVYVSKQRQSPFSNAELLRLTSQGMVDATFGSFSNTQVAPFIPFGWAPIRRDASGRIWWAPFGSSDNGDSQLIVRLTPAGALDTTYSGDGIAVLPTGCSSPIGFVAYLAVLPNGTAVVRASDDTAAAAVAALPDGTPGPLRCDDSSGSLMASVEITARDNTSFFAASTNCLANTSQCGPALRRYVVQANGAIIDDPAFDVVAATVLVPNGSAPLGGGFGVMVDQGKPMLAGDAARTGTDRDAIVVRYGGANAVFANGFE